MIFTSTAGNSVLDSYGYFTEIKVEWTRIATISSDRIQWFFREVPLRKVLYVKTDSSFMPLQKCCPLKFGTAVNTEGLLIDVPCNGKACAWFFDNHCVIISIAKEICTTQKKRMPKGIAAD